MLVILAYYILQGDGDVEHCYFTTVVQESNVVMMSVGDWTRGQQLVVTLMSLLCTHSLFLLVLLWPSTFNEISPLSYNVANPTNLHVWVSTPSAHQLRMNASTTHSHHQVCSLKEEGNIHCTLNYHKLFALVSFICFTLLHLTCVNELWWWPLIWVNWLI